MATFADDGAVSLYHNNVAKLATTSTGAAITTSADTSAGLRISRASGGGIVDIESYNAIGGIGTSDNIPFRFNTNNTERVRIANDGKVGISTSSAENPLTIQDIGGSTFNRDFAIRNGDATNYHRLVLGYNAASAASGVPTNAQFVLAEKGGGYGTNAGLVVGNSDNAPVMFTSNATERMRIASDGKVGVGTSGNLTGYVNLPESDYGEGFNWFSSGTAGNRGGIGHYAYESRIYYGSSDNLTFVDGGPSGTERMRIAAAGNIAIGTTATGDNKLTVEGGVAATNGSSLALKSGGGANSRVADLAFYGTFVTPDTDTGHRRTADITSGYATGNWGNEYLAFGVGTGGGNDAAAVTTERMRITGAGHLLVGTTNISLGIGNTNTGFQVENNGTFLASRADNIAGSLNRNNDGSLLSCRRSGNEVGTIGVTSSATSYNTSSDYRLKENVSYTWDATSQLKQLKPAKFNFIADPDNTVDGFIAHEVQEVVPHAVTGVKDGKEMQGIDHSKLVPLLTASLQEALKRIDSLEEQVNALKGK
jgi:hypothetical protein